jgi:exportin-1
LISLKEFSGDNAELFAEDRDLEKQAAAAAELERAKKVGGLLKPADIDQDDEL